MQRDDCRRGADGSGGDARPCADEDGGSHGAGPDLVLGGGDFRLDYDCAQDLYDHQVEGIKWMWGLYERRQGGILADDMGLGKTRLCTSFLRGLFIGQRTRRVLIIVPKSLLSRWEEEVTHCDLQRRLFFFQGSDREFSLRRVARHGGLLLVTYDMARHNVGSLVNPPQHCVELADEQCFWDVVMMDEAHKVKNPRTETYLKLRSIPAGVRFLVSGTPIQNNLMEFHALMDLCCEGLLGDRAGFKNLYEKPITLGLDRNASEQQRASSARLAKQLRDKYSPYFLRREKNAVAIQKTYLGQTAAATQKTAVDETSERLGSKNDLIVWLKLQPMQRKIYELFLQSDAVKRALNKTASPLSAIDVLRKICLHFSLLSKRAAEVVIHGKQFYKDIWDDSDEEQDEEGDASETEEDAECCPSVCDGGPLGSVDLDNVNVEQQLIAAVKTMGWKASCKTVFVVQLLEQLWKRQHRVLVFSQSRKMLDILQAALKGRKWTFVRIDGTIASAVERQNIVNRFQNDASVFVCLLTTKVGGLGLNMTAADRAIVLDPSWNPCVDDQSVDRIYRIGQVHDVVAYRLMTCGTVEEKIYRRQVFKGGVWRTGLKGVKEGLQKGHFTQQELRDIFSITPEGFERSETCAQLRHLQHPQRSEELRPHIEELACMSGVKGITHHDLVFLKKENANPKPSERIQPIQSLAGDVSNLTKQIRRLSVQPDAVQQETRALKSTLKDKNSQLARIEGIINDSSLWASLPDQGAKMLEKKGRLEAEVAEIHNRLAELGACTATCCELDE
eukprot:evm.model.scf_326.10 EVM.evm.TU.scf_326.10   scf_326:61344-71436(+)